MTQTLSLLVTSKRYIYGVILLIWFNSILIELCPQSEPKFFLDESRQTKKATTLSEDKKLIWQEIVKTEKKKETKVSWP